MNGKDDGSLKLHTDHYIVKNGLNTSDLLNPFEFNVLNQLKSLYTITSYLFGVKTNLEPQMYFNKFACL